MSKIIDIVKSEKIFLTFNLIIILILSRTIPHPPNFTPIIATAIFGPIFLNNKVYGALIVLISMFISDLIISFHSYQFVIYITLLAISYFTPKKQRKVMFFGFVVISCIWFFLITNFAVWLMSETYTKDLGGLFSCYFLAIPFFKNSLISTIIFTSIFWLLHSLYLKSSIFIYFRKKKRI